MFNSKRIKALEEQVRKLDRKVACLNGLHEGELREPCGYAEETVHVRCKYCRNILTKYKKEQEQQQ